MIYGVILAAGNGNRMKSKIKKQFLTINNKLIVNYSIDKFLSIKKINKIIIVISRNDKNSEYIKRLIKDYNKEILLNKINIVIGGKERYDSVYNSLKYINDYIGITKNDYILIHDSARPNVDVKDINKLINSLKNYKVITLASKLNETIKQIDKNESLVNKPIKQVIKTVDRNEYYLIKTPQGFKLDIIYKAYNKFLNSKKSLNITDDLQIIENFTNEKTYVLDSNPLNYKITIQSDLNLLKSL